MYQDDTGLDYYYPFSHSVTIQLERIGNQSICARPYQADSILLVSGDVLEPEVQCKLMYTYITCILIFVNTALPAPNVTTLPTGWSIPLNLVPRSLLP